MSSPDVLSSLLSSLPPRPPTPPREAHHEAVAALVKPSLGSVDSGLSLHTPPGFQSPASSVPTGSTSRRIRKKVGFSAQAEYKDPPVYVGGEGARQNPTPVSLPRSASKPVKSILKVTNQVTNPLDSAAGNDFDPSNAQVKLAAMLESTLQQLAGGDRDSKVDAYLMLTRAWKASNNLPDRVALQEKMTLFTQFMQRDIVAKTPEGNLDTSLVNHALNLLNTFLHFHGIASTISNDFGVFIIDHCIRSFEDPSTPKDTARRLMQVISLQNFSTKVMNSDRVGRLVSSLHNIEEHLKGKSIVLSRVLTYRKLVQQSRQLMIIHSDWLLDMFTDMLSNLRDIRSAAISLGFEAAFSIGHEKQLSRKVMEALSLAYEDKRYIQYYEERLKAMTKDKHESAAVPEIWSVVILLLRIRLDKWEYAGPWLQIIQNCFNSSDFPTKIAANHAWGRLVYLMHLEERALPKNLATLTTPLVSQLRRKGTGKTSEDLRQAVLGGIRNLFYYAFKPGTNPTLLDTYWDVSVTRVLSKLLDQTAEAAEDNLKQASAILTGLFDCMTPRRWRVDHVVESPLVRPEELPAIDPKWIRRNTSRVFAVVQPILEREFFAMGNTTSATYTLWKTLVSAVSSAAAKEIKVSRDTALFVTEALNVLQEIWKQGLTSTQEAGRNAVEFLLAVRAYLEVMISSLGLLPFTEKAGKHQGPSKAPVYTLFSVLSALPPGIPDGKEFAEFFGIAFAPFFISKGDKAKLDFAQDLLSVIPMDAPRPYGSWLLVAENFVSWLESGHDSHHSTGSAGETPVGHDYRDAVKVLERGIRSTPNLPLKHWVSLFYATCQRVREETGHAGVAIVVIEPLAKVLIQQSAAARADDTQLSCLKYFTEVLSAATQPRDRQAVDAARKRLWGTVLAGSRSSTFDTFDNLYKAASEVLLFSYNHLHAVGTDNAVRLVEELGGFFDRGNQRLFLRGLNALYDGLCPWFQDNERLLGSQTSSVFAATKSLWDKLSSLISVIERPEQHLQSLERFFCASFASRHSSVINSGISLWNRLFENTKHLDYPEELKVALVKMQLHADIVLPGLETSSAEYAGQQPSFIDSFDDLSLPRLPSTRSSSRRESPRAISSESKSPALRRKLGATNRRSTPRRLRHDDSQVQFAAIAPSSTPGDQAESQVLTERQKEAREQRQNATLFPEIRSSPGVKSKQTDRQMLPVGPRTRDAATPEPEGSFDDFVSSTPTPRRGQPMIMLEHDMTDPPSSPPEPRGNRLAEEIRSRSASHSLVEDWQFSSSPVSGSPNPNRHGLVPDPSSQRGYASAVSLDEVEKTDQLPSDPAESSDKAEPHSPTVEIIEDSMVLEPPEAAPVQEPCGTRVEEGPSTPRRSPRLSQVQAQGTPSPKSDGEIFVDAPSSPPPPTPRRSEKAAKAAEGSEVMQNPTTPAANTSFDLSEADENSLLRLMVELDSVKADRSEYHRPSPSVSPDGKGREPPIIDCIVVGDSPTKPKASAPSRTRSSSVASLSAEAENISGSQPKPRVGRQKRKRTSSRTQETTPKRLRQDPVSSSGDVPDSQMAPAQDPCLEVHGSGEVSAATTEGHTRSQMEEERIPSSSAEPSPTTGSSSQDSAVLEDRDDIQVEGDSQEVQSQIALEFSESQRQEHDSRATSAALSAESVSVGEPMQVDVQQQPITESIVEERGDDPNNYRGISAGPVVNTADAAATPEQSQVQKIMDLFRSGLDELRLARLSRHEVYQIEDMFMDMRRELYEAERRGRT